MPWRPPCVPGMSRDRLHGPPKLFSNDRLSCEYATKEGGRALLQGRCSADVHLSDGPGRHRSCCDIHSTSVARMESRMRRAERRLASRFGWVRTVRSAQGAAKEGERC